MKGMFAGGLGFGLAFVLKDQFSPAAGKIEKGMGKLDKKTGSMASSITSKLGGMAGALGLGFSLAQATKLSAELSDQMVGVSVVTGMTKDEMNGLRSELEAMDTRTDVTDLLGLANVGSQLGVLNKDLAEFTKTADNMGIVLGDAFGGAEQAVTKIGKMANLFGVEGTVAEQLNSVGSAIDVLNDKTTANIKNVTQFATKMGELGEMGPTIDQALGLGTALDELGVKSKGMASQIAQIFTVMGKTDESMAAFANQVGMSGDEFKKLFAQDPNELFLRLAESFKGMKSPEMLKTMQQLKIATPEAAKVMGLLGKNIDKVRERQKMASQALKEGTSVSTEAAARNATFAAQLEKIQRNFRVLLTRIGDAISKGLSPLLGIVNFLVKALARFAASPFGQAVVKYTAYVIGFAAGVVALAKGIKLMNGAIKMATRSAIRLMIALWPVALVAAPILLVVMAVHKATKAFSEFDGTVKKGIGGLFQKFGGLLAAVKEIWTTWDSATQTFSINNKLMAKLKALGIDKWAINLGTYIVRLREFFKGMFKGMREGFKAVMSVVKPIVKSIMGALESIGFTIGKTTSATEKWAEVGKYVGYAIVGFLALIALALIPIALGVLALIGVVYLLYKAFQFVWNISSYFIMAWQYAINFVISIFTYLGQIVWKIGESIYAAFSYAINLVVSLFWKYVELQKAMFNPLNWYRWGWNAIKGLWNGMKNMLPNLAKGLRNAVAKIPLLGRIVGKVEETPEAESAGEDMMTQAGQETGIMEGGAENAAMSAVAGSFFGGGEQAVKVAPQTINLNLDGEKIGEAVANYNENEMSRE